MSVLPKNPSPIQVGRPSRRSLRHTLLVWLMGVAVIPLVVAGSIGYTSARRSQHKAIRDALMGSATAGKETVHAFFDRARRELDHQSRLRSNLAFLELLEADLQASGQNARSWIGGASWEALAQQEGHELVRFRNSSPWYDILLLDAEGLVLFSCAREDDLGSNVLTGTYTRSILASAVREAAVTGGIVLSDFGPYEPSAGLESAFLVVPVYGPEPDPEGFLAFQIDGRELGTQMARALPEGATVRIYLVDDNLRLLLSSHDDSDLEPLRDRLLNDVTTAWLDSQKAAFEGRMGAATDPPRKAGDLTSYLGATDRQVFGYGVTVEALGRRFGLITELPASEALAGLARIKLAMLLIIIATGAAAAIVGQIIAQRMLQPITALGHMMNRVADGHEVPDLDVVGDDEVAGLAASFAKMIDHLDEAKRTRDRQFRLQEQQAELNERMRGEPDTETLAAAILEHIGDYYNAQAGAFYLARPGQSLVLVAHYGESDDHWPVRRLREGQGVVGRAAMRRRIQVLSDVPSEHILIRSAMGESAPRHLIVAPFHLAGQIKGILELATFDAVSDDDLEFLRLSAESVAVALDSSRSRERVHRLLEETRRQAGTLSRQQKELQDKNERLARSDRYKSEFLANMSHELRTPLNSMLLMAQVLGENKAGRLDRSEVEAAGTIHQAGEELMTIIDDILDLSKVEAGKLELSPTEVAVDSLLSDLNQLFHPVTDRKGIEYRSYRGPGVPDAIFTDGLRVKQILKNLLSNACKFTDKGSVALRVRTPSQDEVASLGGGMQNPCVAFSVADTGIGMNEEVCRRVFEAFNQGDGTIGRRYGGSGLGLSISRRLTELLQGRLELTSVEGKGSKFTLYLPLRMRVGGEEVASSPPARTDVADWVTPEPEVQAASPVQDPSVLAGWNLILADDEMRTIYRLGDELVSVGHGPEVVRRVSDLLGIVASLRAPTVVLVNPWCSGGAPDSPRGENLLQKLRACSGAPLLRLVAMVPSERAGEIASADALVEKPATIGKVLAACRGLAAAEEVTT